MNTSTENLANALRAMLDAARSLANDAGDTPTWNEGGEAHEACNAARAALAAYDAQRLPLHIPGANPPIPSPERIAACVVACEGIETAQLEAMNRIAPGLLARAYDVCSEIREDHGDDLSNDAPISGTDAVDTLCRIAADVDAVVAWALTDANAEDAVHPQQSGA